MTTILLDTHVLVWWSAESAKLSANAARAVAAADELAVCGISWYELAQLAHRGRLVAATPIRSWLEKLSRQVRTLGVTPAIADTAAALPSSFPGDPADRLIYATAIEHGLSLVTKDRQLRRHPHPRPIAVW